MADLARGGKGGLASGPDEALAAVRDYLKTIRFGSIALRPSCNEERDAFGGAAGDGDLTSQREARRLAALHSDVCIAVGGDRQCRESRLRGGHTSRHQSARD